SAQNSRGFWFLHRLSTCPQRSNEEEHVSCGPAVGDDEASRNGARSVEPQPGVEATAPADVVTAYVDAIKKRDLARCLQLYADDAKLLFVNTAYEGKPAIEGWHVERFAAGLEIVRLGEIKTKGQQAQVDVVITSKRLKNWKISALGGRVTLRLEGGRIKDAKLTPRMVNPLEMIGNRGAS